MKRLLAVLLGVVSAGCGSAAYYDYEVLDAEEASPPRADIRSSVSAAEAAPDEPVVDTSTSTLDGFRDSPREMIPPVERMRTVRYSPRHPELRSRCVEAIDTTRAHLSRAIDAAIAINDMQRLRCLSRNARKLQAVKHVVVVSPFVSGTDEAACSEVPDIVEDARACR
ncbi:MAG: hypothetical protein JNK04_15475 [Myxococcales bacterium]|nr:hypothetical protein [Myxococcales bacterium]